MGFFNSNEHKFNYLEEVVVDRNFLNLNDYLKTFKFDQRAKTEMYSPNYTGEHLSYDFFINKRRVRFKCTKRIIKNFELYEKYYDSDNATTTNKGYIGLPQLYDMANAKGLFPLGILELESIALIKEMRSGKISERFIETSKEYYLWIQYKENTSWEDELVKEFNFVADKLIKETLKNLIKLKKMKC